jgi:hydrogenase-1 operon protein HyaF
MNPFPIPVRAAPVGPGSQPEDEAQLDVMPMPRGMSTFEMPRVPERVDPAALAGSRDLLAGFLRRLEAWQAAADKADAALAAPVLDLAGVAPAVLEITNQMLGEGEVAVRVTGLRDLRIQETVFAGLWRCCEVGAQGLLARDWLEAGPMPAVVVEAARAAAAPTLELPAEGAAFEGLMNAPAVLAEIRSAQQALPIGGAPRQINLTLLPMSGADRAALLRALPVGPVSIISRGFGNCHVGSTGVRDVWRVQYFNSMNTLILDTIETVDLPEVAIASADDLEDSRERLAELVQWMGDSIAEASA